MKVADTPEGRAEQDRLVLHTGRKLGDFNAIASTIRSDLKELRTGHPTADAEERLLRLRLVRLAFARLVVVAETILVPEDLAGMVDGFPEEFARYRREVDFELRGLRAQVEHYEGFDPKEGSESDG